MPNHDPGRKTRQGRSDSSHAKADTIGQRTDPTRPQMDTQNGLIKTDTLEINAHSYSSLHSILRNGLDRKPRTRVTDEPAITHSNIRGADYFH